MKTLTIILTCLTLAACAANTANNSNYNEEGEYVAVQYNAHEITDAAELLNFGE